MLARQAEEIQTFAASDRERWLIRAACRRVPSNKFWAEVIFWIVVIPLFLLAGIKLKSQTLILYTALVMPLACVMTYYYQCFGVLLLYPESSPEERGRLANYLWRTRHQWRNPTHSRILLGTAILLYVIPMLLGIDRLFWLCIFGLLPWLVGSMLSIRLVYCKVLERREEANLKN